jgi:hypothetical protein
VLNEYNEESQPLIDNARELGTLNGFGGRKKTFFDLNSVQPYTREKTFFGVFDRRTRVAL